MRGTGIFPCSGYTNINVNQKTYCEDIYGRDRQFRCKDGENRNKLNTLHRAFLTSIVQGRAVNAEHSKQMMELLKRNSKHPRKAMPMTRHTALPRSP